MLTRENTLILIPPAGQYTAKLFREISGLGYIVCNSMKGKSCTLYRGMRSVMMKFRLPYRSIMYGVWYKKSLDEYENILILHDKYSYQIIDVMIRKMGYKGNIYLYYMDPIGTEGAKDCTDFKLELSEHLHIYSFEKSDCIEYGYRYNSLFFFEKDAKKVDEYWSDVFFIGADKGRLKNILEAGEILERAGMRINLHICMYNKKPSEYGKKIGYHYQPYISYDELMEQLYRTKCVLDIVPAGQREITLRVYEGLFCHKKVITNNVKVVEYAFYNSNNIFILGKDDIGRLHQFVNSPFDEANDEEIQDMDFEKWIGRFE